MKLAATLLFVVAVVATPREAFWAFGAHAALVAAAAAAGRLPPGFLLRRLLIEAPFLLFAVFLPFVGRGERLEVIGLSLSHEGLWAAWNIVAKATLGAAASVILAATTRVPDLLKGFARLHFPRVLTAMMGFMVRYLDVVDRRAGAHAHRPAVAGPTGRAGSARPGPWRRLPAPCSSAPTSAGSGSTWPCRPGAIRGVMPELEAAAAPAGQWWRRPAVVALAAAVAALGWVLR